MSFINDLSEKIRQYGYTLIDYGGCAAYVEGVLKILDFSENRVELAVDSGILTVEGEALTIAELEDKTIIIKGKLEKTHVIKPHNAENNGL